jgi:hypothetical protein
MRVYTDQEEIRENNRALLDHIEDGSPDRMKAAAAANTDYTRMILREQCVMDKAWPSKPITDDMLDQVVNSDTPVKICYREPWSPAAVTLPLNMLPMNWYIRQHKYLVQFDRIMTPRATCDIATIRGSKLDLRQIISDNMIKDLMYEKDRKFFLTLNTVMGGATGTVLSFSGVAQWKDINGGITRDSIFESTKILKSTISNLAPKKAITNHLTMVDVAKARRDEVGGDLAQEMFINGVTQEHLFGMDWIVTIKKALVPTNTVYQLADPDYLGYYYQYEEPTLGLKREYMFLEFFAMEYSGATIGNTAAVARADFKAT